MGCGCSNERESIESQMLILKLKRNKIKEKKAIKIKEYEFLTGEKNTSISSILLKDKGEFYIVHRPDRLADIIQILRKKNIITVIYLYRNNNII